MGTQISANYDNVQVITTADLWTIHSATSHVSKEKVCLWVIDVQKLKERYKKKAVRFRYLDVIISSLQQMRKYRHPRILKILEIAEKKPEIGFSSEPFDKSISSQISDLHPMDVAYISYQVAEVLAFLGNEARIVHLGISPPAILLDDQLSIKLTHFEWCSPIDSQGKVTPSQTYDQFYDEFSDNYAKAPEMLKKGSNITYEADIFLFGMFVYEAFTGHKFYDSDDPDTILTTIATKHAQIKGESKIPADFLPLLDACLNPDPTERPSITAVLQHPAYQSMQLKSLRYIDIMLTKNPSDKFAFYKGLSKKIDEFSPSIQRIKLLPTFVNECIADVRFAPILLGAIFQISVNFTTDEFMELIWRKLSVLSTVVSPPEVSIGLLRNLWILLEKVDKRLHKDYVYPIIFSALNAQEPRIHNEVLKHIDKVIAEMNEETLRSLILPRLFDLAMNSSNLSVSSASILCISKSIKRMDNESFCAEFIPKFLQIWRKYSNPTIAEPILDVFFNLNVSLDVAMLRSLPLACEITANNSIDGEIRAKYCNYIIRVAQDFRDKGENQRNFNDQENAEGNKESDSNQTLSDNDNPFAIKKPSYKPSSTISTTVNASKPSSSLNESPNPFATDDDNSSPFGTRNNRSHSSDTYPSKNNESASTTKSSAFSDFDSPNPFASSISDKSKNDDDDDDDDNFGKRKNVFSFGNNNNAVNLSKDAFNDNSNNNNSTNTSRNVFSSSDNSSKDVFGSTNTGNSSKNVFGSNNNSGLSRKRADDFDSGSVFSKRDSNMSSSQQPVSSQPFNEDIFKSKAFQETADDIFGPPKSNSDTSSFAPSKQSNPSTSVFNNNSSANPSTSVFNSNSSANPSTSVFSSSPSKQSNSSDFSSNIGLSPISANDIFGSSTAQSSSIDNYIANTFGNNSNSSSNQPSPLSIQAPKHQLNSGGFGDFGNYSSSPATTSNSGHQTGSTGSIINTFNTGLDSSNSNLNANNNLRVGGFGSNFSTPASITGFPPVGKSNNTNNSNKQGFNPFQNENNHSASFHHGSFNPFQSENGGGGAASTDGMPSTMFNSSGRMQRNANNASPFQFGQGGMSPQSGSGIPRKNPSTSASYDILDIFN